MIWRNLAAAVLALSAAPALGAAWVRLSTFPDERSWVDADSITEEQGIRRAWFRARMTRPDRSGIAERMSYSAMDCRSREVALISVVERDRSGRVLETGTRSESNLRWRPIVPDSVGATRMNFVCSYPIGTSWRQIEGLEVEE
jgi:hypothetical protein